jgi:hypothetical protein
MIISYLNGGSMPDIYNQINKPSFLALDGQFTNGRFWKAYAGAAFNDKGGFQAFAAVRRHCE